MKNVHFLLPKNIPYMYERENREEREREERESAQA
jgi:hypothetical protein